MENEQVHLIHTEETLQRQTTPIESITALAFALMADACEEKCLICAGSDDGDELSFYPEIRGSNCYYQFYTAMEKAPEDLDLLALPLDEFLDLVDDPQAGIIFNSGDPKELVLDLEMIPFLKSVLHLSIQKAAERYSPEAKQVKEEAEHFTWD